MNSRRFASNMGLPFAVAALPSARPGCGPSLAQRGRQVRGANLNCSESKSSFEQLPLAIGTYNSPRAQTCRALLVTGVIGRLPASSPKACTIFEVSGQGRPHPQS
jgi:hypothetical protein